MAKAHGVRRLTPAGLVLAGAVTGAAIGGVLGLMRWQQDRQPSPPRPEPEAPKAQGDRVIIR